MACPLGDVRRPAIWAPFLRIYFHNWKFFLWNFIEKNLLVWNIWFRGQDVKETTAPPAGVVPFPYLASLSF
jgi:hypothetical protein